MTPCRGNTSLAKPTSLSGTIEGLFELTRCPSRALALPRTCPREKQGHRQVCRAKRRGPRTLSKTTDANLDCARLLKTHLITPILGCNKSTE